MSSEVKANKVSPATGTDFTFGDSGDTFTVPSGATLAVTGATVTGLSAGKVLQVVSATKTDTSSTTGQTFVTTGLEVSITPTSTSNKVLVLTSPNIGGFAATSPNDGWGICLLRDTTEINLGDQLGSNRTRYGACGYNVVGSPQSLSLTYLDSPSSTSSITYKVAFRVGGTAANSVYMNRANYSNDLISYGSTSSTITVMEIAG
jgi:hypothetical protein